MTGSPPLTWRATQPKLYTSVEGDRVQPSSINSSGAIHLVFPASRNDAVAREVHNVGSSSITALKPKSMITACPVSLISTLS